MHELMPILLEILKGFVLGDDDVVDLNNLSRFVYRVLDVWLVSGIEKQVQNTC